MWTSEMNMQKRRKVLKIGECGGGGGEGSEYWRGGGGKGEGKPFVSCKLIGAPYNIAKLRI